jgi:hypothetical protein
MLNFANWKKLLTKLLSQLVPIMVPKGAQGGSPKRD